MKAQFIFAAIVAGSVAVAGAQSQTPRPEQKQDKQQAQTVTVTGCLQRATDTNQPATAGQPTRPQREPGSSDQFVLAQAKVGAGATGTAGAAGTTGSLASADKFRLIGGKPNELKEHLNHRIEITGTLQPRSERGQEKGTGVGDPQKPAASEANLPALRVTGFKHVAATCGPM